MADTSKAQKLASARKKFKELKKEKKKHEPAQKIEESPGDNVSTGSSREATPFPDPVPIIENTPIDTYNTSPQNVSNYFLHSEGNSGPQETPQQHPALATFFDSTTTSSADFFDTQPSVPRSFFHGETTPGVKLDEPQISTQILEPEPISATPPPSSNPQPIDPGEYSNLESLRQLSDQMADLINPTADVVASESQLEMRNQQLASQLGKETLKNEQLSASLLEYQAEVSRLESQIRDKELDTDGKIEAEVARLKEELQCHVQTVGILFGEKTELAANLSQLQVSAKQKNAECEELAARLKASRSRVADLEREVNQLKSEKSHADSFGQERNTGFAKLKSEHEALQQEKEELLQDLLEVREKFKSSSQSNLIFQQQLGELSGQLSMANVKIQQLTSGEVDQSRGELDRIMKEKFALERQIADLTQTVRTLSKEREESNLQYQQYAQQLNAQINTLALKLDELQKDNENCAVQEQNRIRHIGELEKQLQSLQSERIAFAMGPNAKEVKLSGLEVELEKLQLENNELRTENGHLKSEIDSISRDLDDKVELARQLEQHLETVKFDQPDSAKLLAVMESDRIAAARAVAQNNELKQQLESMQEVFEKMNRDKVELTEHLEFERRSNKELLEKIQKTEGHVKTLADAIEIKDRELVHLREDSMRLDREVMASEQLNDRLRHYEAHDHSSHSLQTELQDARLTIQRLTERSDGHEEIEELRHKLRTLEPQGPRDSNHNTTLDKESAMRHLEAKFLKTMEDIADLTDEKQRLEHLVLQLQGETETIGEYVALYQHQRGVLRQKAIEKDQQLSQLASDRQLIKTKLEKLNGLVRKLVLEKGALPPELLLQNDSPSENAAGQLCEEHERISSEISKITQLNSPEGPSENGHAKDDGSTTETAEEIIALLSEIKSSNLVQPTEEFHHCPWCSGQLITV